MKDQPEKMAAYPTGTERDCHVEWVGIEDDPQTCAYCDEWVDRTEDFGGWWSEPVGDGTYAVLRVKHKWCWEGFMDAVHDTYDDEGVRLFWDAYAKGDAVSRARQAVGLRSAQ